MLWNFLVLHFRCFQQVPPSGPTGCSVVASFSQIPNGDWEKDGHLKLAVLKERKV